MEYGAGIPCGNAGAGRIGITAPRASRKGFGPQTSGPRPFAARVAWARAPRFAAEGYSENFTKFRYGEARRLPVTRRSRAARSFAAAPAGPRPEAAG